MIFSRIQSIIPIFHIMTETETQDYKLLYEEKMLEYQQLDLQYLSYKDDTEMIITDLEKKLEDAKKKIDSLGKELQAKEKKKSHTGALERELEHLQKQKNDFQTKFNTFQKKVVDLENINEALQNQVRASKIMLSQYEQRVQKTMEELALLQTQFAENKQGSKQQITRLKNQLKQTEQQLYVIHLKHKKHNSEIQSQRRSRMSSVSSRDQTPRVQTPVKQAELVEVVPVDFKRKPTKVFHKTIDLVTTLLGQLDSKMSRIKAQRKTLTAI